MLKKEKNPSLDKEIHKAVEFDKTKADSCGETWGSQAGAEEQNGLWTGSRGARSLFATTMHGIGPRDQPLPCQLIWRR